MFFGWLACNTVFVFWAMLTLANPDVVHIARQMLGIAFATAIVILAAWLVIFWPVDMLVPDHSRLREPRKAAVCGFLAVFVPCYVILILSGIYDGQVRSVSEFVSLLAGPWNESAVPFTAGTLVTGTVAAFMRCYLDPNRTRTPK
jgi:hypothetical protein